MSKPRKPNATYAQFETPAGPVYAAWSDAGVQLILPSQNSQEFEIDYEQQFHRPVARGGEPTKKLRDAIYNGRADQARLDLGDVRPFTRLVLQKTADIPRGQTASYGDIAKAVGRPNASQAVGRALGANPIPCLVPCHRVIAADGTLGGYSLDLNMKAALLEAEGAPFKRKR